MSLTKLLEAVEADTRISMDMTDPIAANLIPGCTLGDAGRFHEGCQGQSLDAALALKESMLPDALYFITGGSERSGVVLAQEGRGVRLASAEAGTPARALLICVIKALIEKGK